MFLCLIPKQKLRKRNENVNCQQYVYRKFKFQVCCSISLPTIGSECCNSISFIFIFRNEAKKAFNPINNKIKLEGQK